MFCSTLFQRSFIPPRSGLPHATRVRKVQSREQHTKLREEVQRAPFARVAFVLSMRDKLFALGVRPRVTSFVMEIVSSCPMPVHGFTWPLKSGRFAQEVYKQILRTYIGLQNLEKARKAMAGAKKAA